MNKPSSEPTDMKAVPSRDGGNEEFKESKIDCAARHLRGARTALLPLTKTGDDAKNLQQHEQDEQDDLTLLIEQIEDLAIQIAMFKYLQEQRATSATTAKPK